MRFVKLAPLALVLFVPACGSSGGEGDTTRKGQLNFSVEWPKGDSRLIPAGSNSVKATLQLPPPFPAISATVNRPSGGGLGSVGIAVQEGAFPVSVTAHPERDGIGTPQASGSSQLAIQAGRTTNLTVTLQSTISSGTITPANPGVDVGASTQLGASFKNAAGSVVLVAPSVIRWATANGNVSINNSGMVTGINAGTSEITVTDTESGKAAKTVVTVNSTAPTPFPPANPGANADLVFKGAIDTNSDGRNLQNAVVQWFDDGTAAGNGGVASHTGGSLRIFNKSRQVIHTEPSLTFNLQSNGITPRMELVVPCFNEHSIKVYDIAGRRVTRTITELGGELVGEVYTAKCNGNAAVIAGPSGLWLLDTTTWQGRRLSTQGFNSAGVGSGFVYTQRSSDLRLLSVDFKGNVHDLGVMAGLAYDIEVLETKNLVAIALRLGNVGQVHRFTKAGASKGSPISLPSNEQVRGIGTFGSDRITISPSGPAKTYVYSME